MSETNLCPSCGRTRPDDDGGETCRACRTDGAATGVTDPDDATPLTRWTAPPSAAWPETRHYEPEGTQTGSHDGPSVGTRVRYFGDYELLERDRPRRHGRRLPARQVSLNRLVALKMIRSAGLADGGRRAAVPRRGRGGGRASTTRTSCRSTRSASTTASTTSA